MGACGARAGIVGRGRRGARGAGADRLWLSPARAAAGLGTRLRAHPLGSSSGCGAPGLRENQICPSRRPPPPAGLPGRGAGGGSRRGRGGAGAGSARRAVSV